MRQLALLLGGWAARLMHPVRPTQALAMYAEIENLPDHEALAWALGCLAAACRQRASLLAVTVVSARLCIALAAGMFGLLHVMIGGANLWLKLAQMSGDPLHQLTAYHAQTLQGTSLSHWLSSFAQMSLLGGLHMMAATMLAVGRHDRVHQLAFGIIAVEVLFAITGVSGLTLSVIYLVLITMMATTSTGLAWLWRWDERRMAQQVQ